MRYQIMLWGLSFFLIPVISVSQGMSQGVCVISERRVPGIYGLVLLPNGLPITDATVELRAQHNRERVIAQVRTDENGRFRFGDVGAGRYVVIASHPTLVTLYVPLRVTSRSNRSRRTELVITLNGLIDEPCGGGSVTTRVQGQLETPGGCR